jgi:hypothetical protein
MTPLATATEVWEILHTIQPRLFEEAQLNFRGRLRPGLTIKAEVMRKQVEVAVEFEIIRILTVRFIDERIPNMATWAENHAHFAEDDQRIPPFSCSIDEENRPHYDNTLSQFRLADGVDVPDTAGARGGGAGGISPKGYILPPITSRKSR